MKKIFICTNYGSIKDGIGMYTFNLVKEIEENTGTKIEIITGKTEDIKGKKKLFSFKMFLSIFNFIKKDKNNKEKVFFIIEYPFMDWNPLTILLLIYLKKIYKKSKMILSIHEYYRVNILRRKTIDILIRMADGYIITDKKLFEKLKKPKILRNIPSNIDKIELEKIQRLDNNYCYFGLINKSKAFDEMIEAWKIFNKETKFNLNIYTSSEIEIKNKEEFNIKLYKGLSNQELSIELQKNRYMILPIKPSIDSNNGTLKAAALHECIPIGIFSENFLCIGIDIPEKEYTIQNITESLQKTLVINKQNIIKELKVYSDKYSFTNNAEELLEFLKEIERNIQ